MGVEDWEGANPNPSDCSHWYRGWGGTELWRGMCVLSLLRRHGFRMIQGIAGKGVCVVPLPLPTAILLSRSFHTQRGCNQVSVGCSEYAWTIWAQS